jgi:hypothetical protein
VFTTLLTLLNGTESESSEAIEGLLCCVQLPNDEVANFIVKHSEFSRQLVRGMLLLRCCSVGLLSHTDGLFCAHADHRPATKLRRAAQPA